MTNFSRLCVSMAIVFTVMGCNQAAPDTHDADVAAIKAGEVQWNQDSATKDVDKVVAHYADDATLMAPGMPPSTGKAAILASMKGMVADPAFSLQFETSRVEVAKSGDVAFTQGSYTLTMTDPGTKKVVNDHGSYVTGYKKQADESWKAVSDIATSSVPPPSPAPAKAAGKKKK